MNHKQITLMQARHKADRLGYIAKLSVECDVLNFYSGDPDKPATWLHVGRARVRNGCVDAVTVSLAIGRRVKP